MNASLYSSEKRGLAPIRRAAPSLKIGNLFGGDKKQTTITNTTSDSFNRTDTSTSVTENAGNTSLAIGGSPSDSLPLLIGGGLIIAAILAAR